MDRRVVLRTKDRRMYAVNLKAFAQTVIVPVRYKRGRRKTAHFDFRAFWHGELLYVQRPGRGEPRLDFVPPTWQSLS